MSRVLSLDVSISLFESKIRVLLFQYYSISDGYIPNVIIQPRVHIYNKLKEFLRMAYLFNLIIAAKVTSRMARGI